MLSPGLYLALQKCILGNVVGSRLPMDLEQKTPLAIHQTLCRESVSSLQGLFVPYDTWQSKEFEEWKDSQAQETPGVVRRSFHKRCSFGLQPRASKRSTTSDVSCIVTSYAENHDTTSHSPFHCLATMTMTPEQLPEGGDRAPGQARNMPDDMNTHDLMALFVLDDIPIEVRQ